MMDAFDLASRLFGNSRAESRGDVSNSLDILTATGAGDSSDGAATVYLDADVTPADDYDGDDYAIGIPTSPNVIEGDGVLVGLTGSGALKTPVVISNPGSGDRMQVQVDNAETLAEQAEAVASATGQHFWTGDDGVHVTEVTQEDWSDAESPDYHSGANVLLNALGQLFRDGLNNLMALTTGATHTETFQIRSDDQNRYTLVNKPMAVQSVTIGGTATSDYRWYNYDVMDGGTGGGTVTLGSETWADNYGSTLSVTYRTSPAMTIYDGLGNLAANIQSYFTATEIGLGGSIYEDMAHRGWQTASVRFFGANDNRGASLDASYSYDADTDYIGWDDSLGLGGYISDADAPTVNGCSSGSGITTHRWLYDDSEGTNNYLSESKATLYANSYGGDAADATARLGVKTATVGDDYARSYVTLGDGTGEDTDVPLEQAIAALTTPLYSATVNASVSGTGIDAYTTGASVSLPAGTYLVIGAWEFNTATTSGTRNNAVALFRGSTYETQTRVFSAAQNYAALQVAAVMDITTQTTVSVRGASTRASNAAPTKIYALRVS